MINLFVAGQKLTVAQPLVAADTIDYLEVCVHPQTASWRGRSIWAHFQQSEKNYQLMLTDLQIRKDAGLNLGAGEWKVWLHGTAEDGSRITTDVQTLTVQPTGPMEGGPLPEISPTVAEQIDAKSQQALNAAQQAVAEAARAKPYAESAQANATAAAHSAEVAGQLEASAADSAFRASSAATAAAKSAEQASGHATAAQADAGVAAEQAGQAAAANTAAQQAKTAAAQSAKEATDSAALCAGSTQNATRAEAAAKSAAASQEAASGSATAAQNAQTAAETAAGNASTAAQTAADKAAEAGRSATAAGTSADTASAAAQTAAEKATAAAGSASSAQTDAGRAETAADRAISMGLTGMKVGDTVEVASVDARGVPTGWRKTNWDFEIIAEYQISEDVESAEFTLPAKLKAITVLLKAPKVPTASRRSLIYCDYKIDDGTAVGNQAYYATSSTNVALTVYGTAKRLGNYWEVSASSYGLTNDDGYEGNNMTPLNMAPFNWHKRFHPEQSAVQSIKFSCYAGARLPAGANITVVGVRA